MRKLPKVSQPKISQNKQKLKAIKNIASTAKTNWYRLNNHEAAKLWLDALYSLDTILDYPIGEIRRDTFIAYMIASITASVINHIGVAAEKENEKVVRWLDTELSPYAKGGHSYSLRELEHLTYSQLLADAGRNQVTEAVLGGKKYAGKLNPTKPRRSFRDTAAAEEDHMDANSNVGVLPGDDVWMNPATRHLYDRHDQAAMAAYNLNHKFRPFRSLFLVGEEKMKTYKEIREAFLGGKKYEGKDNPTKSKKPWNKLKEKRKHHEKEADKTFYPSHKGSRHLQASAAATNLMAKKDSKRYRRFVGLDKKKDITEATLGGEKYKGKTNPNPPRGKRGFSLGVRTSDHEENSNFHDEMSYKVNRSGKKTGKARENSRQEVHIANRHMQARDAAARLKDAHFPNKDERKNDDAFNIALDRIDWRKGREAKYGAGGYDTKGIKLTSKTKKRIDRQLGESIDEATLGGEKYKGQENPNKINWGDPEALMANMQRSRQDLYDVAQKTMAPNKTHLWLRYRKDKNGKTGLSDE